VASNNRLPTIKKSFISDRDIGRPCADDRRSVTMVDVSGDQLLWSSSRRWLIAAAVAEADARGDQIHSGKRSMMQT